MHQHCPLAPGGPPSPPLQPYDQASGCAGVGLCLDAGDQSSGSHAGLQPHQGQRQQNPVLLLHFLQGGVASHHHPGRHAPDPDGDGVRHPAGHAAVLLHPDLQLPEGATDGKTRQGAKGDASVRRHRGSVHGVLLTHHGDDHRGVGHPFVPPLGLLLLLHFHPAHHRVSGPELPELGPGSHRLRVLQLHVQEGPLQLAALLSVLQAGRRRRRDRSVFVRKSDDHPAGTEILEG